MEVSHRRPVKRVIDRVDGTPTYTRLISSFLHKVEKLSTYEQSCPTVKRVINGELSSQQDPSPKGMQGLCASGCLSLQHCPTV